MNTNNNRVKRILSVLQRHKTTMAVMQDLQLLAQQFSLLVEQPKLLRELLEGTYLSGWDNIQHQIIRVSGAQQQDHRSDLEEDDNQLNSSSNLSSNDEGKGGRNKQGQKGNIAVASVSVQCTKPIKAAEEKPKKDQQQKNKDNGSNASRYTQLHPYPLPFVPGGKLPPPPSSNPPPAALIAPRNPSQPQPLPQSKPKYVEKSKGPNPARSQQEQIFRAKQERRNSVWLKNLPKHYNTIDALSGFFKKFGQIRDVYPNPEKNSACIVYFKQQDAVNAFGNSQKVFGKPLIFKTLNPDEQPPEQLMEVFKKTEIERKKSQSEEKIKLQAKELRQNLYTKFGDRYRVLLFLFNRLKGDERSDLTADIENCRRDKAKLDTLTDDDLQTYYDQKMPCMDYDFTVTLEAEDPRAKDRATLRAALEVQKVQIQKFGRFQISRKPEGDTVVRFQSLHSLVKLMTDPDQNQKIKFNNEKITNCLQRVLAHASRPCFQEKV